MSKLKILGSMMSMAQTKDRWYNVAYYLKTLPPWAKERGGRAAMSTAQQKVTDAFAEVQTSLNDAGLNRWQRRESTAKILRGRGFGGVKIKKPRRSPVDEGRLRAAISTAMAITGRYAATSAIRVRE